MDSIVAIALAVGGGVILLAVVLVAFRPKVGGDPSRGHDDERYGTSALTGRGATDGEVGGD